MSRRASMLGPAAVGSVRVRRRHGRHGCERLGALQRALVVRREDLGVMLDVSRMGITPEFLGEIAPRMTGRVRGDEEARGGRDREPRRRTGWSAITGCAHRDSHPNEANHRGDRGRHSPASRTFAKAGIHSGEIPVTRRREPFRNVLVVGIGGSALGPQFVCPGARRAKRQDVRVLFRQHRPRRPGRGDLSRLGADLNRTITVVISKSGSTKETRNGMLEARAAYQQRMGLDFGRCAVAVTGELGASSTTSQRR